MSEVAERGPSADESEGRPKQHGNRATSSSEVETSSSGSDDQPGARHLIGQYGLEAAIGIVLAVVILYVAWASSGEVPFVYEGY